MNFELRMHHLENLFYHFVFESNFFSKGYSPEHTVQMNRSLAEIASSGENVVTLLFGRTGCDPICLSCPRYDGGCTQESNSTAADAEDEEIYGNFEIGRPYTVSEVKEAFFEM